MYNFMLKLHRWRINTNHNHVHMLVLAPKNFSCSLFKLWWSHVLRQFVYDTVFCIYDCIVPFCLGYDIVLHTHFQATLLNWSYMYFGIVCIALISMIADISSKRIKYWVFRTCVFCSHVVLWCFFDAQNLSQYFQLNQNLCIVLVAWFQW